MDLAAENLGPIRPASLTQKVTTSKTGAFGAKAFAENSYFEMARPAFDSSSYKRVNVVTDLGIANDGIVDVTAKLQAAVNQCAKDGTVLFLPYGYYLITDTVVLPKGTRILGE